jgi:phospholipid/cholesterol/gamma-HCH transport system ATP-binding protein
MFDEKEVRQSDEMIVRINNLHYRRGSRNILDGININIPKGKVTTIMGPSGCGKTTLLRLIGGQLRPEQGSVSVLGKTVHTLNLQDLYELRKRMGMLFQSGGLFTHLSVYENVAFPVREHTDLPEALIHALVLMKLQAVGLRGARYLMPAELSGGMARRVALARAIALDPMIMMYDEPFTGQDPITVGVIMQLIRLLNDSLGMTSIIVSHDVYEVCAISDQLYMLGGGKVMGEGSPDELQHSPIDEVKQFMNALPDGPVPFHYPAKPYDEDLLQGSGRC